MVEDWRHLAIEDIYPSFRHGRVVVTSMAALLATHDARHQLVGRHVEVEGGAQRATPLFEPGVERPGLGDRTREPIQNGSARSIRLLEAGQDDPGDEVIRQELTAAHHVLCVVALVLAQQIAARDVRHAQTLAQLTGLGALTGPRPAKDEQKLWMWLVSGQWSVVSEWPAVSG